MLVKKSKKTQCTEVIDSKGKYYETNNIQCFIIVTFSLFFFLIDDILKKYVKSVTLNFGQNEVHNTTDTSMHSLY